MTRRIIGIWAGVVLALVVAVGLLFWIDQRHSGQNEINAGALSAATTDVEQAFSYGATTVSADLQSAEPLLADPFLTEYRSHEAGVVAKATKDGVTTSSVVKAIGQISASGGDVVTVLIFLDQTSTSTASAQPTVTGSRIQVTVIRHGGTWQISELKPL